MTTDKTARFEDRLLSELQREVALNAAELDAEERAPAPRRRLFTAPRLGLAAAGGAAVAAGFVLVPGAMAPPAYAIEEKPDGSVQVSIQDLTLDKEQQQELAADLRAAGVTVETRSPDPGMRCTADLRVGSLTVLPGKNGDGVFTVGSAYSPKPGSVDAPEPPGDVGSKVPWSFAVDAEDSMVIENYVPKEGGQHRTSFYIAQGEPEPCEPVPADQW
ncbi:hypothetical protein FZ103_13915 [Streptomonospora sp. PA3]|uniref:hypothetical protein n=1 Tax=Streptomonospora sp. PA3 TaxID=2607326 RepID=UPI0012DD576C|nr:hypothetical protein [Streptomonospora sp. PA3]MUL42264.1 hypothetical protein [Streptomonospora sp. PA3]